MSKSDRMEGTDRLETILDAGAKLAGKYGAVNVTRKMVAKDAKVSPALVTHYVGSTAEAQVAYAKRAKKLGIAQPDKATIAELGAKLRAHGPRKVPVQRKRSDKEKAAIKRNVAAKKAPAKVAAKKSPASAAKSARPSAKPTPKTATAVKPVKVVNVPPPVVAPVAPVAKKKPAAKSAARAPLAPPVAPHRTDHAGRRVRPAAYQEAPPSAGFSFC